MCEKDPSTINLSEEDGSFLVKLDQFPSLEIFIKWSEEDGVFIARAKQLPSLAAHGDSTEKALEEFKVLIGGVMEDLKNEQN